MLFNSFAFLLFVPIFFTGYFLLKGRYRLVFCVVASYFFYGWWDWRFTSLLFLSTFVDYFLSIRIYQESVSQRRRFFLILSLISNLGILGIFKYFDFFVSSFKEILSGLGLTITPPLLHVILPVGISFYTFQTLSYTIDVYRGAIKQPERDFICFSAYVALFPQLVAGPIVRAAHLLPQLKINHKFHFERVCRGGEMILWGFFLKLCLADTAAIVVNPRFEAPEAYGPFAHIVGIISFSFQIYGDFAGYSLIAIGLGKMMGLDFGINFNRPYFSQGFSEFWRKWHISLSTWLRDYLYVPLGGNARGRILTFRNLVITMFLGGLWHGAGWNFVLWGLLHGFYLVLQRILSPVYWAVAKLIRLPRFVSVAVLIITVFTATNFAWIFFRADNIAIAGKIIHTILDYQHFSFNVGQQFIAIIKTFFLILIVLTIDFLSMSSSIRTYYFSRPWLRSACALSLIWFILLFGTFEGASFIYFQF